MRVLIASDVSCYQALQAIAEKVKPDLVVIAGDILYDGKCQCYIKDDGRIIGGNTHGDPEFYRLHVEAFKHLLESTLGLGATVALVYGDHDVAEGVDYAGMAASWGYTRNILVARETARLIDDSPSILLVPYRESYRELRILLRENRRLLERVDVIVTHQELSKLRIIARHVQYARSGEVLLASGHKGIGYYSPGQAWKDLVADPIRIYELALKRLPPPPHAGPAPVIGELMGQVRREETRKHRWLIEDRILHLARTDLSPRGFLLLETGGGSRLTGELHVIPWADGDTGSTHCPSGWEPGIKLPGAAGRAYPAGLTLRCRFQVPRR